MNYFSSRDTDRYKIPFLEYTRCVSADETSRAGPRAAQPLPLQLYTVPKLPYSWVAPCYHSNGRALHESAVMKSSPIIAWTRCNDVIVSGSLLSCLDGRRRGPPSLQTRMRWQTVLHDKNMHKPPENGKYYHNELKTARNKTVIVDERQEGPRQGLHYCG